MSDFNNLKEKKITEILFVVKFSSLLFAVIGYFRFFVNKSPNMAKMQFLNTINAMTILFFMGLVFALWLFFDQKGKLTPNRFFKIAQPVVFILFYMGSILLTGGYKSQFKFLFIFLIVSYTIEWGLKSGVILATISSLIIMAIDFAMVPSNGVNTYLEDDLVLIGLFFVIAITIGYYVKLEREHIIELNKLVNVDALTELYNHRYFHSCLKTQIEEAENKKQPISLFLCDIDYFKIYNDTHGHVGGDNLLREIAQFFNNHIEAHFKTFRYGGDEFAVLLPGVSREVAFKMANIIRAKFSDTDFSGQEFMPNENITLSIGVSTYDPNENIRVDLLQNADEALYKAKHFERNRVEVYVSLLDGLEINNNDNQHSNDMTTTVRALISVINGRDQFTYNHLQRVVSYCRVVENDYDLSKQDSRLLCYAAYMHDIGKIDIPKDILMKTDPLTKEELQLFRRHPMIGAEMIGNKESLKEVAAIVLQHHEWYDGTGYPNKIKGENIHYLSRVLTVIDSFDTMTSDRPHKVRKNYKESINELRRCSGTQFDPEVVKIFIKAIAEKCFPEYDLLNQSV